MKKQNELIESYNYLENEIFSDPIIIETKKPRKIIFVREEDYLSRLCTQPTSCMDFLHYMGIEELQENETFDEIFKNTIDFFNLDMKSKHFRHKKNADFIKNFKTLSECLNSDELHDLEPDYVIIRTINNETIFYNYVADCVITLEDELRYKMEQELLARKKFDSFKAKYETVEYFDEIQ